MAESEIKVSQELTEKRVPITRENVKYQGGGGGAVNSVNGQTGDVVLTAEDVGALPDTTEIPTNVSELINDANYQTGQQVATAIGVETTAREGADSNLQSQIDAISASSDVTDIVGTYAELQAYDTSTLGDKDIIKVLQDESRNDETTYYRWSTTTQTFTLIGEEGPYYTKSAADAKFQDKLTAGTNINIDANNEISATDTTYSAGTGLDLTGTTFSVDTTAIQEKLTAGANITIANDNTISATDTTYSDFTGTDGQTAGTAGLVPAPATTDADKYLKSDGTWGTVAAGPTVVQTTGTSTTDVMSQEAVSNLIWPTGYESIKTKLSIGGASVSRLDDGGVVVAPGGTYAAAAQRSVAIGWRAQAYGSNSAAIGQSANTPPYASYNTALGPSAAIASSSYAVAVGSNAYATKNYSVALGAYANSTRVGEVNIGTGTDNYGYNSTSYRVLGGVHDPVDLHDAATKNYVDNVAISFAAISGATAPTIATEGEYVGQLYYDTTNDTMYYLSSIDDTQTPVEYNWSTFGGGGPTVVQTTGTSTTDVMSQKAATNMIWPAGYENNRDRLLIAGPNASVSGSGGIVIATGNSSEAAGQYSVVVGTSASASSFGGVAIGGSAKTATNGQENTALGYRAQVSGSAQYALAIGARSVSAMGSSVALGYNARTSRVGEVNIGAGTTTNGYNSTSYRVLGGVHPAVDDHDAVTLGQINARILAGGTAAPTAATVGSVGSLYAYVESGTGHLAICTAVSGTTYTWQTLI